MPIRIITSSNHICPMSVIMVLLMQNRGRMASGFRISASLVKALSMATAGRKMPMAIISIAKKAKIKMVHSRRIMY